MEKITEYQGIQNRIKHLLYILSGIIFLAFFYTAVKCNIFGGTVWDLGAYFFGSIITLIISIRLIYRADLKRILDDIRDIEQREAFLRVSGFAVIFLMTLYYYDSSSEYGHTVGLRIIILITGLIIISYNNMGTDPVSGRGQTQDPSGTDSVSKWGQTLLVAFGIFWMALAFAAPHILAAKGALNYDAVLFISQNTELSGADAVFWKTAELLPLPVDGKSTVPYVLWGLMVLAMIKAVFGVIASMGTDPIGSGEPKGTVLSKFRISKFGYMVMLFFISMLITANGRLWVIAVVIPFTALGLCPAKKDTILREIADGVMLSFWVMAAAALLFRPYYSFEFVRYPGWFASVASASMYRMLVVVSALCSLMSVFGNKERAARQLYCLITLGTSLSVLLMGMARTALLGTAVVFAFVFIISEAFHYKDSLKGMAVKIGTVILCFVMLLPCAYTGIRCMPALVSRPVWITGPEWFSDRIMNGETASSSKYMNVPQLAESLLEKLAGIEINLSYMAGADSGPGDGVVRDQYGHVVSTSENVVGTYKGEDGQNYSVKDYTFTNEDDNSSDNGRLEILEIYGKGLNLSGHRSMLPDPENIPDGSVIYHSHNTYMQAAHDHGIVTGVLFIIVCLWGMIKAILFYKKNHINMEYAIYPLALITSFAMAGLTEWVFHPSIPSGYCFLAAIAVLMKKD